MQLTSFCLTAVLPIETGVKQIKSPISFLPTNNLRIFLFLCQRGVQAFFSKFLTENGIEKLRH
jgi:hypothetical protein